MSDADRHLNLPEHRAAVQESLRAGVPSKSSTTEKVRG